MATDSQTSVTAVDLMAWSSVIDVHYIEKVKYRKFIKEYEILFTCLRKKNISKRSGFEETYTASKVNKAKSFFVIFFFYLSK